MIRNLILSAMLLSPPFAVEAQDDPKKDLIAFKFGRIFTATGPELAPGTILVEHGKIKKIGGDFAVPTGARIVDLSSYTAMPGMIDASSGAGVTGDANEEAVEITPAFRILDSIDPRDKLFQQVVQLGVTSLHIEPGNRNVIGGLSSVLKPTGRNVREMLVREDVMLKAAMGREPTARNSPPRGAQASFFSRRPTTRMGVVWEFRKAFLDARTVREEKRSAVDEGKEILLKAMEKKIPVRMAATRSYDIESALRLADEFGLSLQLEEAEEAYRYVDELVARKVPVALRPWYRTADLYMPEGGEVRLDTFSLLTKAGLSVSLLPWGWDGRENLLAMASFAVKYGASREEALRAVTINPAAMLGVSDRVGSLEEGKDADFVVLTGDPLDVKSRIDWVFIEGRRVFGKKIGDY